MPDLPVETGNPGRYPGDMESRVAVLKQIARTTIASLDRKLGVMAHGFHWL